MQIEIADISAIPLFNEDVEAEGWPPAIANLRQQVAASDALLISTPEYNYSLPGVLKNTIDWLSRVDRRKPAETSPLDAKPLGIIGVSVGQFGTTRAQLNLR
jgi:chromate reductase, NAD(P)H dehydrogenase (quinone)